MIKRDFKLAKQMLDLNRILRQANARLEPHFKTNGLSGQKDEDTKGVNDMLSSYIDYTKRQRIFLSPLK